MQRTVTRYRYGIWAGRPQGLQRDPKRCIVAIRDGSAWGPATEHQCHRTALHGPAKRYCGPHAAQVASGASLPTGKPMQVTQRRESAGDKWTTIKVNPITPNPGA